MSNPFDQFDNAEAGAANPFDQFDAQEKPKKQNKGILGDIGTGLKRGVEQMPGMVTGLADLAAAPVSSITGVNRPFSRAADYLGDKTGFQPGKWAEQAAAEYSPEMQQSLRKVQEAEGFMGTLGAIAENPRSAVNLVAESLPSTLAGGILARGAMGAVTGAEKLAALRAAAAGGDVAAKASLMKAGSIAGGIGEGAVTAGQQMAQTDYDVNPLKAAGAAAAAGIGTGIIGGVSGRIANKLGLADVEGAIASGTLGAAKKSGKAAYAGRIAGGALQEGVLEELPQSAQEQVWQNVANDKPWDEGVGKASAQGLVAGMAMGAGVNALPGSKYVESKTTQPAEEQQPIAGLLPAPNYTGTPGDQLIANDTERQAAIDAADANAAALYAARDAFENQLRQAVTIINEPAPLQRRIDDMLSVDSSKLNPIQRANYEKTLAAAFGEQIGIRHDANQREVPFTMGEYLDAQVAAENAVRARPLKQNATQQADTRLQQVADEEGYVAPDVPVVGTLSAMANMAIQSGAHKQSQMQQAMQAAVANQKESNKGTANAAQVKPLAQEATQTNDAQVGPATAAPQATSQGIDLSQRTDGQLSYLSKNGQPGWKEAAIVELQRRGVQVSIPQQANSDTLAPSVEANYNQLSANSTNALAQTTANTATTEKRGIKPLNKWTAEELQNRLDRGAATGDLSPDSRQSIEARLSVVKAADAENAAKEAAKADRVAKMRAANEANKGTFLIGTDKDNTERVSVRNGTVYLGDYAAEDFETGDDITVPEGATKQQIFDALINGKAVTRKIKIFGKNGPEQSAADRMAELEAERSAMSPVEREAAVAVEAAIDAVVSAADRNGIEQSTEPVLSYIGASNEEIQQSNQASDDDAGAERQAEEGQAGAFAGSEREAVGSNQERNGNAQGQAGAVANQNTIKSEAHAAASVSAESVVTKQEPIKNYAPKQKAVRNKIDPEKDSLFVAIAKAGGMDTDELLRNGIDSADITRETAGRVNKKTGALSKKRRMPISYGFAMPLHKKGGMSFDAMLEAMQQYGYLPADATKNDSIDLFKQELAGDPVFTAQAIELQQEQDQEAFDKHMQEEQYRIDAELAAREIVESDSGYNELSNEAQSLADDFAEIAFGESGKQDNNAIRAGMRALGFTEEEINDELAKNSQAQRESEEITEGAGQDGGAGRNGNRTEDAQARERGGQEGFDLAGQTNSQAADQFASQQTGENDAPTKAQADQERDAVPFSLGMQSQPKPQGVQTGFFAADGRVSVEAKTVEKSIADLQKELEVAKFGERTELNGILIERVTDDAEKSINNGEMPVYQTGKDTFVALHPSAQQDGMIQATRYSDTGVFGDSQYKTAKEAVRDNGLWFKRRMSETEASKLLEQSLSAESEYQKRKISAERSDDGRSASAEKQAAPNAPEWHTALPLQGLPITDDQRKPSGYGRVPNALADEAYAAITQNQLLNGMPMYAYYMPAANGLNGIVRLIPDDQNAAKPWVLLNGEAIRPAGQTKEQVVAKLTGWLRSAPVLGDDSSKPVEQSNPEPKKGDRFKDGSGKTWEIWNARSSLIESFPVIDGKIRVNNQDGQRWATDSRARSANPEARTDFFPIQKEKKPVTPQLLVGDPEKYIKVAADSIKELRKPDVYRVLVESNRAEFRLALANYIKEQRPDLADEVDSVLSEEEKSTATANAEKPAESKPVSERDSFELNRLNRETGQMENITFERGEYVRYSLGSKDVFGDIDGISHARREFSVDGLWHPFGFAYKAERPAKAERTDTVPLSSVIDKVNTKFGEGLTEADRVPPQYNTMADVDSAIAGIYDGTVSLEDYKAAFNGLMSNKETITAELGKMTIPQLHERFGKQPYGRPEKKVEIVERAFESIRDTFGLRREYGRNSYTMGRGEYEKYLADNLAALTELVNSSTSDDLKKFADEIGNTRAARQEKIAAAQDPKTIEDFNNALRLKMAADNIKFAEARMSLTPEQRAEYDRLRGIESRDQRKARADQQKTDVRVASQTTGAQIVEGTHSKHGYALWSVQLADRVDGDSYKTLLSTAKRMGGNYVNQMQARMWKTVWGFQFKDQASAEAFMKLAAGDKTDAEATIQERRDAFADDRSQSAVERLNEMAERLEEKADESLGRERKANTERRARFAASAEAAANAEKAMAKTMRRIAEAISNGTTKFLDRVRQKAQIEYLAATLRTAKGIELRTKYPSYVDQQRHEGEPATSETADYAEFPQYAMMRSDLANLARKMVSLPSMKMLGQRILKAADDTSTVYNAFAKEHLLEVSRFGKADGSGFATFSTQKDAEHSIEVSSLIAVAVPLQIKRGEYRIVLSPSEAINRGIWNGDDRKMFLSPDIGEEIVEKLGRLNRKYGNRRGMDAPPEAPWQFENAYNNRKRLAGMGIEQPWEFRAALREFAELKEAPKEADKIKAMERAMVGRKNDGLDFFPTPAETAQAMVDAADISEGMSVLEPSAGMGHIAEQIRDAGNSPDVIEFNSDRRELLEAKGFNVVGTDFMEAEGKYDRIIMNPPFSNRRDAEHVRHAYSLLNPGGRVVAIMGEGVFFGQDKKARAFREWLDEVGGTSEKLEEGTFLDPSLPVNTATNARMVVIDKPAGETAPADNEGSGNTASNDKLTPTDKAIYGMAAEGKSAAEILKFIASASRSPMNRQLAKLLQKTGIAPVVTVGDSKGWKLNAGEGNNYAAAYNPKTDTVALFRPASAERHVLHELIHAATIRALGKKGLASIQMKALFAHVQKNGKSVGLFYDKATKRGVYGMADIDEFIAEAFSNPKFQEMLKQVSAPSTSNLKNGWNWFVRIVRNILGLPQGQENALSQAIEIGLGVMREDMKLRNSEVGVPFSEITGKEIEQTIGRTIQEKASNWMRAKLQGKTFSNDATGWDISVGRKGINKTISHGAKETHARSVAAIPSLLKNAILVESEENRNEKERDDVPMVHHFYAPLRTGGGEYIAHMVVKETRNGQRFYDYETSDEISPAVPEATHTFSQVRGVAPSARLTMSMTKLLSHVKKEHGWTDPKFTRYANAGNVRNMPDNSTASGRGNNAPAPEADIGEAKFYRTYMAHIDIRGRASGSAQKTRETILRDGFNTNIGTNAFPPYRGGETTDFNSKKYKPSAGDVVYFAPKGAWKDTPNGPQIVSGWRPKSFEAVTIRDASLSAYEQYRQALEKYNAQNEPTASAGSDAIRYNVADDGGYIGEIVGDSGREYDKAQREFFKNVGRDVSPKNLMERAKDYLQNDFWKKVAVGIVDQFRGLRDLKDGGQAYLLARLSKGTAGAFETLLHHGKLSIKDGVYDGDQSGGFIEKLGVPLHGELDDFLWWVAANRAEGLAKNERENLFTPEDIAAGKSLASGETKFDYTIQTGIGKGKTTRSRAVMFADAQRVFNEFQKNALDMAEQSGLIDGAARKFWESEFYVPFYRVSEEDGEFIGAKMGQSLVRQQAFKKLKGGTDKLNSDLLSNTLLNWSHLIEASSKNRAAKASLSAAENVGAAQRVAPDMASYTASNGAMLPPGTKKTVWFQEGGSKVEYLVSDPFVMTAITSLEYAGMHNGIMDVMTKFKHWLTIGVTASPAFKVRNLIRDSVQAIGTSELGYNPAGNIKSGYAIADGNTAAKNFAKSLVGMDLEKRKFSQEYVSALSSGGLIRFGTMLEGKESDRVRQLIKSGVKDSTILDSESKWQAFYDKHIEPAIGAYNELGNVSEEINRAALYSQLIKQGVSHAYAALQARDLMDFSMQGSFNTIRFLSQVVPFFNARLVGMYKLGRAAKDDPRKLAIVMGAVALAGISLMLAYGDDDDWKKREDWDLNNYFWFKFGGVAFRIPRPFEIGAVASIAERGLQYMIDDEMTGERFASVMGHLLKDNLAMNPVPQMMKPVIDLYANKDSFSGRPIETMSMEKIDPTERYTSQTSMVARGASKALLGAASPVQIDHLLRGYFGWLGTFVVGGADMAARTMVDEPTKPTMDYFKFATQGIAQELPSSGSRYVTNIYEQAKELEQAHGTWRRMVKEGRLDEAKEYAEDNKDSLSRYKQVETVKRAEAKFSERIRAVERSDIDPDEKKARIANINKMKDAVARRLTPGYSMP